MASLKKGVLLKLLESIKDNNRLEKEGEDDDPIPRPVVLQIRGIIPVLEEGDLWPNKGFFLKVSDSSHALYVSLSQQENEMILGNRLKLGQFIHVKRLQRSHPLPLLKGVTPVPGRRRCEGTPEDIIIFPVNSDSNYYPVDSVQEKGVISEEKKKKKKKSTCCEWDSSPVKDHKLFNDMDAFFENDSDCDSIVSSASSSSRASKRRSWNETELLGVKQIFDSSAAAKGKIKLPTRRSCSANVSPVRSVRYDSSDDNSSSTVSRRRVSVSTNRKTPINKKGPAKTRTPFKGNINNDDGSSPLTGVSWTSLPQNLVKLGKEALRQRDIALLAAADALQEACVSERLLNSLSAFSQFCSTESSDDDLDRLFRLHRDLAFTRLIMQSLTSISPFETDRGGYSVKETIDIAVERNRNSLAWIKSAAAADLSLPPRPRSMLSSSERRGEEQEWTRGGKTLSSAAELASSLQEESRRAFLNDAEKYVDEADRRMECCCGEAAAAAVHRVKMVSDFLDGIVKKEGEEEEVYGRVRDKIYGILLKHVERTAMAFQRIV